MFFFSSPQCVVALNLNSISKIYLLSYISWLTNVHNGNWQFYARVRIHCMTRQLQIKIYAYNIMQIDFSWWDEMRIESFDSLKKN